LVLELSGEMLKRMGSLLFGGGVLQVALTIALVTGVSVMFGVNTKSAIYTGCLVALSSTAVVLKLLSSRDETNTPTGEVPVAFLIFQDIAVVILVLLVPKLGDDSGDIGEVVWATVRAVIVIALVVVVAKWAIPPILDQVSRYTDDEVFLLTVLALAGGVAYAVTLFGLTVSLGAFVAGLVVAAGAHRERATKNILPFQVLFASIFFASIGMLLDPQTIVDLWPVILLFCVVAVVIKLTGTGVAARVFRRSWPVVAASSFVLAQVGEFAFILEKIGREVGLAPADRGEDGSQVFIAVTVAPIAITPLLFSVGRRVQRSMEDGVGTRCFVVLLKGRDASEPFSSRSRRPASRSSPTICRPAPTSTRGKESWSASACCRPRVTASSAGQPANTAPTTTGVSSRT
jgi:CPA2 family monovalent cation:H+ antiporter-2